MPSSRRDLAPWAAAGVAALVLVASVLAWLFLRTDDTAGADATYTGEERSAVAAAGTEMANLTSYTRANFDKDFQRALDGATGQLRSDLVKQKASTKKTLVDGKFDLRATVTHTALVGKVDNDKVDGYVVLVSLNGFQSTQPANPTPQNLQVTVVKKSGRWLANDVTSIGVS